MQFYDVTVPLCATTPTYPGDPGIELTEWLSLSKGDPATVTLINLGAHTGTHVDAPAHFIEGGARVETLPLDVLIGEAVVHELPDGATFIGKEDATKACASGSSRILFKTHNSQFWNAPGNGFRSDYAYIDPEAAEILVRQKVKLVGIDYLSVEKFHSHDFATHHLLLSNSIVIVEGLDLREVTAGRYEFICLPLRLRDGGGDGAPARAVLRRLD